jgi:hypothetical protein
LLRCRNGNENRHKNSSGRRRKNKEPHISPRLAAEALKRRVFGIRSQRPCVPATLR